MDRNWAQVVCGPVPVEWAKSLYRHGTVVIIIYTDTNKSRTTYSTLLHKHINSMHETFLHLPGGASEIDILEVAAPFPLPPPPLAILYRYGWSNRSHSWVTDTGIRRVAATWNYLKISDKDWD